MKKIFKYILLFLIILLPWGIGFLFSNNTDFYNTLTLPKFAPKPIVFGIVWPILYVLITISIFLIFKQYKKKIPKNYLYTLIVNYLFNQSFSILFFTLKSPFLGMVASLGTFISGLFLFNESYSLNKKASYFLIPYLLWGFFATILSFSIFLLNL